jgi:hypothetical protein
VAQYRKAYQGFDPQLQYRRMVEVKLNALGVDPQAATPAAGGSQ